MTLVWLQTVPWVQVFLDRLGSICYSECPIFLCFVNFKEWIRLENCNSHLYDFNKKEVKLLTFPKKSFLSKLYADNAIDTENLES